MPLFCLKYVIVVAEGILVKLLGSGGIDHPESSLVNVSHHFSEGRSHRKVRVESVVNTLVCSEAVVVLVHEISNLLV